MGCTPMMQKWRSRWRVAAAECVSKICAAINKEKNHRVFALPLNMKNSLTTEMNLISVVRLFVRSTYAAVRNLRTFLTATGLPIAIPSKLKDTMVK